jgi:beta-lactamase regulating signal transducer with metallopeptidase domain
MSAAMLYTAAIGALLGAVALVTERIFAQLGWARRGVWVLSLVASLALPAYALLSHDASRPGLAAARSAPLASPEVAAATGADRSASSDAISADWSGELAAWAEQFDLAAWRNARSSVWPKWRGLDKPLALLWVASTAALLIICGIAWLGLRRAARRWPTVEVDGAPVLVSERLGPAVFGFLRPRVVVPRWLLEAPGETRAIALRHEREHVAARDHVLLAVALLLMPLAPWNPALWWQLRRLRFAIEVDCDARVTRRGIDPIAYANVLLAVRRRHAATPFAAVALTEPKSQLEKRIRVLMQSVPKIRPLAIALASSLATALLVAACAIAPPDNGANAGRPDAASVATATEARGTRPASVVLHRQPVTNLQLGGEHIVFLVDVSGGMLGRSASELDQWRNLPAAQQRTAPKWRQLVTAFERLTEQVPVGARFQVIAFNGTAHSLIDGTDGAWVSATDDALNRVVRTLRGEIVPAGSSNLDAAFTAAGALTPAPDNVFLLTDGLPTVGAVADDTQERIRLFNVAVAGAPAGAPVNVILLPKEGEPVAAPAFWTLAFRTDGAVFAPPQDDGPGGALAIPEDGDYLVFVVDTSGSMKQFGWGTLQRHVAETLAAHPNALGIQFVTDEGAYLLDSYRDGWIPNNAEARSAVLEALVNWNSFSNSDPREGVVAAIEALYAPDKRIVVYVYGDDQGVSSDVALRAPVEMLNAIERANRVATTGARKVRINAVALPTILQATGDLYSAAGYAAMMRELAQRNGGSFIALASL